MEEKAVNAYQPSWVQFVLPLCWKKYALLIPVAGNRKWGKGSCTQIRYMGGRASCIAQLPCCTAEEGNMMPPRCCWTTASICLNQHGQWSEIWELYSAATSGGHPVGYSWYTCNSFMVMPQNILSPSHLHPFPFQLPATGKPFHLLILFHLTLLSDVITEAEES